ncbi:MAG: methyl-accepting chemotaxis protein [Syntrophobacteraceae bacterium]
MSLGWGIELKSMTNWNAPGFILTKIIRWPAELLSILHGEGPHAKGWRDALRALGSDLESLGKSTEGEFLAIGEKLQGFYQRAVEISKISSSVANLMSGEELGAVIEGFRNVIERMKRLEGESRRNTETLRDVLENITHLNHQVEGFRNAIRRLRVLCVSTKIESVRLVDKETGFDALADEVGTLSFEIENRCFQLLASSESLNRLIGHTLSKVLDLEATQQTQAGIVLDKTMSSIESLLEKHGLSAGAAGQISTRYEAISLRIGEIVTSMQFHDITRQRIEHVQQALAGLCAHERPAGNGGQHEDGRWAGKHLRLVGNVSALQAAQLHHAREELVSAVNKILDNLSALADLVKEIAQETSRMAGAADETGHSFLTGVEAGFSSATSALKTYGEADRELSLAMGSAGGMLGEISAHTGGIESIGEKIKLIALNAAVKACHLGDQGATLGVLAEAIHQLSVETCRRTENASHALRSITSASESLCADANASGTEKSGEMEFIGEALRTQLQTLHDVNQGIVSLLTRMNLDGLSLSEDIRKTIDEVHVHRRVDLVISNVASGLEEIAASSQSKWPAEDRADRAESTKTLRAAYTMQGEREVHNRVVERKTNPAEKLHEDAVNSLRSGGMENEKTGGESGKADEEDLGENVEFF